MRVKLAYSSVLFLFLFFTFFNWLDKNNSRLRVLPLTPRVHNLAAPDKDVICEVIPDQDKLSLLIEKCSLSLPASTSELLHFWRLRHSIDSFCLSSSCNLFTEKNSSLTTGQIENIFFNSNEYKTRYPNKNSQWYTIGPKGLRVPVTNRKHRSGEGHPDQFLFCLSESGISLDREILLNGKQFTVRDILVQSMFDYNHKQPLEFTAIVHAYYVIDSRNYPVDGNAKVISFKDIVQSLTTQSPGSGWCYGCHTCYAIAMLLNLDDQSSLLTKSERSQCIRYLADSIFKLEHSQHLDGAWRHDWEAGIASQPPFPARPSWGDDILVTGHHLEWIAIVPPEVAALLDTRQIAHAIQFLFQRLEIESRKEIRSNYLPWSHAARALLAWHNKCI